MNRALDGVQMPHGKGQNERQGAAMRPFCQITLATCLCLF